MVTALAGTAEGAVYVVGVPLAVVAELNDPQEPLGAQLHVTPPLAESLLTVAVRSAVVLTSMVAGAPDTETEIAGGGGGVELLPEEHPTSAASINRARLAAIA